MGAESDRLASCADEASFDDPTSWRAWGPFVADRSWGTVREDYSADGEAWGYLTHDQARSKAYRWGEDGLAGVCDRRQGLALTLSFWNGRDRILKERLFGLGGKEGNHGEDVKEYWWHVDATPTHSWLHWRYAYTQAPYPYQRLVEENAQRGFSEPEFELGDTGLFAEGYWLIDVQHAKAAPNDLCLVVRATNRGPERSVLRVLPTLTFRNTWSWNERTGERPVARAGAAAVAGRVVELDHERLGRWTAVAGPGPDGTLPTQLFCENETNVQRLYGTAGTTAYPKDGINDHVVSGAATVNPDQHGTRAAWWYQLEAEPGEQVEVRVRLAAGPTVPALGAGFDEVVAMRANEAEEFWAEVTPPSTPPDEAHVLRRAFAGLLWSQQFYRYSVARWLEGDEVGMPPPPGRDRIRNGGWRHLDANDVICMPDPWEYPWFASWDLAFHCVALAHIDPALAKQQILLLTREWYQHPNGQLPAYEWEFSDANPPVHAWAAMRVFETDGGTDTTFLARVFHKLLLNFTWWVNRKDELDNNVFEGGFLGLDNIGPFNRSQPLPESVGVLEQSDATAWMAMYCLDLLNVAATLSLENPAYQDLAVKFVEHFALIADALNRAGLWDEDHGFFFDVIRHHDGSTTPVPVRSMVGLIPLFANWVGTVALDDEQVRLPELRRRLEWFFAHQRHLEGVIGRASQSHDGRTMLLSAVSPDRLGQVLAWALAEDRFLSPHGLRSLSKYHLDHPVRFDVAGSSYEVRYEPAESSSGLFGGNSNWRGPVWFPVNFLVVESLRRYARFLGPGFTVELPVGSGHQADLGEVADELSRRLVSLFLPGADGVPPVFERAEPFRSDPSWAHELLFFEYFDGDTGAGLGASHQTGWTALVADLILSLHRPAC